jgi:hypothetical protein
VSADGATVLTGPSRSQPPRSRRTLFPLPFPLPGRLLRLELRRSTMLWVLPLVGVLFWLDTYRRTMTFASAPLWSLRSFYVQEGTILMDCSPFVAGVAAWTGSRDGRRETVDLVAVTARPRWTGRLATWAATTCWAVAAYLGCVAVIYGMTARQAGWGGPPWWPVAVGAAGVAALCAIGFAAGVYLPSRFTAPLTAVIAFFALNVSHTLTHFGSTYAQILPVRAGYATGSEAGVFYPYLPDVSIAQLMLLLGLTAAALGLLGLPAASGGRWLRVGAAAVTVAGLLAAGTGVALAGTIRTEVNGAVIPALHDAANDRPIVYTPVCAVAVVPVCVHPAYRAYLPDVTTALTPLLSEVARLPGAPVRVNQVATSLASEDISLASGTSTLNLAFDGDVPGAFGNGTTDFIFNVRMASTETVVDNLVGVSRSRPGDPAQQAIATAITLAADVQLRDTNAPDSGPALPGAAPGTPAYAAAQRFAALPAATRHAWLAAHLAALRAGGLTLTQLP